MKRKLSRSILNVIFSIMTVMAIAILATLFVSAESEGVTIYASNLNDGAMLGLSDDTTLVMDVDLKLSKIVGEDCDLTIVGDKTLTVNSEDKFAIMVRELTVEANLIAASPTEYYYGSTIYVTRDFQFTGDSLWVGGSSGIFSSDGDIFIYGSTTIYFSVGAALQTAAGHITVDTPYIKCALDESETFARSYCAVDSAGEVDIWSNEGIFVGVDAGIHAGAMITLSGNISCEGSDYGIKSDYGRVYFDGYKLYAYGETGILAKYDVIIDAANGGVGGDVNAVKTTDGNIVLNGSNYIASDGDALVAETGYIDLNGTNYVKSFSGYGIRARQGRIIIGGGYLDVTAGGDYALYANQGIEAYQYLKILTPENGRLYGNTVIDAHGYAATHVEICEIITKISAMIDEPIAGMIPATHWGEVGNLPDGCSVYSIKWYENGAEWDVSDGNECFEAANTYKVEIVLWTYDGIKFADTLDSAMINNKNAVVSDYDDVLNGEAIVLSVDFGYCHYSVSGVELTVTSPKEGDISTAAISNLTGASVWETTWLVSDTGADGTYVSKAWNSPFAANKYYKVQVLLKAVNNHKFATYDDGVRIQPNVDVCVNGYQAEVYKSLAEGEELPSEYIIVEYDFGKCNDSVIEEIVIENVVAPIAGACPSYTLSILGSCFDSEGDAGFHQNNGMEWTDVTTGGGVLYPETKFIIGHTYQVTFYLHANEGYEFATNAGTYPATTATVNGNAATVLQESNSAKWQTVTYQFVCGTKTVDVIELTDLDYPEGNKAPDTDIISGDPSTYTVDSVTWYNADLEPLEKDEMFATGRYYNVEIRVVPGTIGAEGIEFSNDLTVSVNGTAFAPAEGDGEWNSITVEDDVIIIRYAFKRPAASPMVSTFFFTVLPEGGTVKVGEAYNATWKTSFVPTMVEIQYWNVDAWEQWDVLYPNKFADEYDFVNLSVGEYTFRIVAYNKGEPRAVSGEFTVAWEAPVGWHKVGGEWYFFRNGERMTGWQKINGYWYYMNSDGVMQTGWVYIGSNWYYFSAGGAMQTGWITVHGNKFHLHPTGAMATGWAKIGDVWYLFGSGGATLTGWQKVGGTWYYMNSDGVMQTGWVYIGSNWYYFSDAGAMQTGWITVHGNKFYLNPTGAMATGWTKIGNAWYLFGSGGAVLTGWQKVSGTWYYMNSNGVMQTGWQKIGGYWYYFKTNGAMVTGTQTIGGKTYTFNSSGVWIA